MSRDNYDRRKCAAANYPWSWEKKTANATVGFAISMILFLVCDLLTPLVITGDWSEWFWFLVLISGAIGVAGCIGSTIIIGWPKKTTTHCEFTHTENLVNTTLFRHQRPLLITIGIGQLLAYTALLGMAISLPMIPDNELPRRSVLLAKILPLVLPLFVGWAVLRFALFIFSSRKILGIGLSPVGVYHWTAGICSFYEWNSIDDFATIARGPLLTVDIRGRDRPERPVDPEENWLGRQRWIRDRQQRKIRLELLPAPPAIVYQALFFYLQHPELRHELGTDQAEHRLHTGDFPDIIQQIKKHGRALTKQEAQRNGQEGRNSSS